MYKPIFTHKDIKGFISQRYTYSTRRSKHIVAVPYTYEDIAISLLFCDHQDIEFE